MSLKQNTGEEEPKKMVVRTKGEEGVAAWWRESDQAKPETYWFKPKPGSVIPKKRRLVKSMILDYVRLKLTASAPTSADSPGSRAATGEAKRVHPHSPDHGN